MEIQAVARNTDHMNSFIAADKMNADNCKELRKQQGLALLYTKEFEGNTSTEIGILQAAKDHDLPPDTIRSILKTTMIPVRRMSELEKQGLVNRDDGGKCYLTPEGLVI